MMSNRSMSTILKEMALTVLVEPELVPSSEAAAATLLLSHVAWQRANGDNLPAKTYPSFLAELENVYPEFWRELKSKNPEEIIAGLVAYKEQHYLCDTRKIVTCSSFDQKVRVEWTK